MKSRTERLSIIGALVVGFRGDNMAAKMGGSVIIVIGVLGAIACVMTG